MTGTRVLRVPVADLLGRTGQRRELVLDAILEGLSLTTASVPPGGEVHLEAVLEAVAGGLTLTGTVSAPYEGPCRRCLEPVGGQVRTQVREVFAEDAGDDVADDLLPIHGDHLDLEPLVREAVLLSLPLAPLCGPDCQGPDPERFPTDTEAEPAEAGRDPRWAALDGLRLDDADS